jgi:hypothetical protein
MNKYGYTTVRIKPEMIEELYMLRSKPEYLQDNLSDLIRKMVRLGLDQVQAKKK